LPGSDAEIKGLYNSLHYIIAFYNYKAYKRLGLKYLTDFESSETKITVKNTSIRIDKF
jgi:hypothetical protein